ncbi:MAG: twin-arginine translocase TatA/TatE family subunit [Eggerthellaceae bacterium]|nr:twin-arginine translocase TatA/TatE family subunit [Eggerthellaceae bacterium]
MFGIGANELLIILIFGFIIFGPDKLPAMAKTLGQAIAKFRNAQAEMSKVIKTEVYDPDAEDPFKNPLDAISKLEQQVTKEDRGESFTQRKARYDKQRAARKASEERKAELAAKKEAETAAKDEALARGESEEAAKEAAKAAGEAAVAALAAEREANEETEAAKKRPTADELYGTKPKAKQPKKAPSKADIAAQKKEAAAKTASEPKDKQVEEAADTPADKASASEADAAETSTPYVDAPEADASVEGEGE